MCVKFGAFVILSLILKPLLAAQRSQLFLFFMYSQNTFHYLA